jgi:hypothetical protein
VPDDLFLRAPKGRQAEHGIQQGEGIGSYVGHASGLFLIRAAAPIHFQIGFERNIRCALE